MNIVKDNSMYVLLEKISAEESWIYHGVGPNELLNSHIVKLRKMYGQDTIDVAGVYLGHKNISKIDDAKIVEQFNDAFGTKLAIYYQKNHKFVYRIGDKVAVETLAKIPKTPSVYYYGKLFGYPEANIRYFYKRCGLTTFLRDKADFAKIQ